MVDPPDDADTSPHTPVLFNEVLSALTTGLSPGPESRIIDGTVGAAGHAVGILAATDPDGTLLGLDRDPAALELARERLSTYGSRVHLEQGSFAEIRSHARSIGWETVQGVLLDLGLSSLQLSDPSRGFSFKHEGPLDMRFDPSQPRTASDLVNQLNEESLADLLRKFGEEPKAGRIARAIVKARPIEHTKELAGLVERVIGKGKQRIHPATRTFQALRIAVNDELNALEIGLAQAVRILAPEGKLVVISFHSLEDRIVKRFFREASSECNCPPEQPFCTCEKVPSVKVLTKKPIRPSEAEIDRNPRARSARLRIAMKLEMA
jgi:16S rRNA (cytosine1402-N4)-methyltransferase